MKTNNKIKIIALAISLVAGVAQADSFDRIKENGYIKLGYREKSVPVSFKDIEGQAAGQTVDLCKQFVSSLEKTIGKQLTVEWVMVTPKDRIEAVKTGKIDMECGSTTNTAKRRVDVDFSIPTYISNMRAATLPKTKFKLFDSKVIKYNAYVIDGTSAVDFISIKSKDKNITKPDYNKIVIKDMTEALDNLKENPNPSIIIYDDILLISAIKSRNDKQSFFVTDDHLSVDPYGIMTEKGSKLGSLLNNFLKNEMQNGNFLSTYNKWFINEFKDNKGILVNLEKPMNSSLKDVMRFPTNVVGN